VETAEPVVPTSATKDRATTTHPYIETSARLRRLMTTDAPRMTTQTLSVLSTMLADPDADWYGFELSKHSSLKPGTIYPILARLLKVGWLERRWEDIDPAVEGRPRRRLYRLTGVGVPAAHRALEQHLTSLHVSQPVHNLRPRHRTGLT
jgi:PadR family transcriptional regulator, regulatory protein PadR